MNQITNNPSLTDTFFNSTPHHLFTLFQPKITHTSEESVGQAETISVLQATIGDTIMNW